MGINQIAQSYLNRQLSTPIYANYQRTVDNPIADIQREQQQLSQQQSQNQQVLLVNVLVAPAEEGIETMKVLVTEEKGIEIMNPEEEDMDPPISLTAPPATVHPL